MPGRFRHIGCLKSLVLGIAYILAGLLLHSHLASAANTAIGFGWDEAATQELIYQVDLDSGIATSIGVIDGLRFVASGSHAVDGKSTASLMLGLKDGNSEVNYLFLSLPKEKKTFSFPLPGNSRSVNYQQAFIHPATGDMFLLTYNVIQRVNQLYKVSLDLVNGTLTLTLVGAVNGLESYSVGTPKMLADGTLVIPAAGSGGSGSGSGSGANGGAEEGLLFFFDTTKATSSVVSLSQVLSHFVACESNSGRRMFGAANVRGENGISSYWLELNSQGTVLNQSAMSEVVSTLAGTAVCSNQTVRIVGENEAQERGFYSYAIASGSWSFSKLSASSLKYLGPVDNAIVAAVSHDLIGTRAQTRFALISNSDIKECARKFKKYFKKGKSAKIRAANTTLTQFQFSKSKGRYSCALKKKH